MCRVFCFTPSLSSPFGCCFFWVFGFQIFSGHDETWTRCARSWQDRDDASQDPEHLCSNAFGSKRGTGGALLSSFISAPRSESEIHILPKKKLYMLLLLNYIYKNTILHAGLASSVTRSETSFYHDRSFTPKI